MVAEVLGASLSYRGAGHPVCWPSCSGTRIADDEKGLVDPGKIIILEIINKMLMLVRFRPRLAIGAMRHP